MAAPSHSRRSRPPARRAASTSSQSITGPSTPGAAGEEPRSLGYAGRCLTVVTRVTSSFGPFPTERGERGVATNHTQSVTERGQARRTEPWGRRRGKLTDSGAGCTLPTWPTSRPGGIHPERLLFPAPRPQPALRTRIWRSTTATLPSSTTTTPDYPTRSDLSKRRPHEAVSIRSPSGFHPVSPATRRLPAAPWPAGGAGGAAGAGVSSEPAHALCSPERVDAAEALAAPVERSSTGGRHE
jgi:hypothetical protein